MCLCVCESTCAYEHVCVHLCVYKGCGVGSGMREMYAFVGLRVSGSVDNVGCVHPITSVSIC